MRPEVEDLQNFYASRQGQLARRLVHHQVKALWPDLRGLDVVGFGYAAPLLAGLDGPRRTVAFMPAEQGASRWPQDGRRCRTAMVREDELPLADGSVDRVLLVHALECCTSVPRLMREVWRVLADGGRLLAIVPNRRGLWCLSDRTPFGHGQPYSAAQLQRTLNGHLFATQAERTALFLPPVRSRLLLRLAIPVERLGLGFARRFAGLVLIEAEKRIYVGTPALAPATHALRGRRYLPVADGVAARAMAEPERPSGDRARGRSARVVPLPPRSPRRRG